jgi:hypothetical protein
MEKDKKDMDALRSGEGFEEIQRADMMGPEGKDDVFWPPSKRILSLKTSLKAMGHGTKTRLLMKKTKAWKQI